MLIKVVVFVAVVVGGVLAYVGMQSDEMNISREAIIKASPEAIFPYLNNAKMADEWMPWAESDPQMRMTYSGPSEGLGSISIWESAGKMGTGKAEIVESVPNQRVKTQLTYTKPMEMSQLAELSLSATGDGTVVKWSVTGKNTFIGRLFCLFMNMDKTVGGEFEKGLAKLKLKVENTR